MLGLDAWVFLLLLQAWMAANALFFVTCQWPPFRWLGVRRKITHAWSQPAAMSADTSAKRHTHTRMRAQSLTLSLFGRHGVWCVIVSMRHGPQTLAPKIQRIRKGEPEVWAISRIADTNFLESIFLHTITWACSLKFLHSLCSFRPSNCERK